MWQNYLKITIRTLWYNKLYTIINILGLSISMAVVMLIAVYVSFELSFDRHLPNHQTIYRHTFDTQGSNLGYSSSIAGLGPYLKENYVEITDFTRIKSSTSGGGSKRLTVNPTAGSDLKYIETKAYYADPNFLEFFHFPILKGNKRKLLFGPNQIIISRQLAEKYYGVNWENSDLIGNNLEIIFPAQKESKLFTINGIFEKIPNSHFRPDLIMSMKSLPANNYNELYKIKMPSCKLYFEIDPIADLKQLKEETDNFLTAALNKNLGMTKNMEADGSFQKVTQIHFDTSKHGEMEPGTDIRYNYFLIAVGLFIMICAWVNYLNMAVTKSLKRVKEVGIRKTLGAKKLNIVMQFLQEGFWLNLISLILAVNIAILALPLMNNEYLSNYVDWPLQFWIYGQSSILAFFIFCFILIVTGTLVSGIYPALTISSFNVIRILKGLTIRKKGIPSLRHSLLLVQFVISALLTIGIFAAVIQMKYMMNKDLGFEKEQNLILEKFDGVEVENYINRALGFKNELVFLSGIEKLTSSSTIPGQDWRGALLLTKYPELLPGMDLIKDYIYNQAWTIAVTVSPNFLEYYDIDLVAGRWFPPQAFSAKPNQYLLVNQKILTQNGFTSTDSIIGMTIYSMYPNGSALALDTPAEIIGVVENYHHQSLKEDYLPMVFRAEVIADSIESVTHNAMQYFSIRMILGDNPKQQVRKMISKIESLWQKHFPELPFQYFFLDDAFNNQYKKDIQLSRIFAVFGGLSVFISCLGLFGLSSFLIQQRTKEIGIRKILGASLKNLFALLTRNYMRLVVFASVIAIPIAYLGIKKWLEDYAFRIELSWWFFVVPLLVLFVIAMSTIGYKIIKTARANPVDALRYE